MKNFDDWFYDSTKPAISLPEDIYEKDGKLMVICCRCDNAVELSIDIQDHEVGNYWCGGSLYCCP